MQGNQVTVKTTLSLQVNKMIIDLCGEIVLVLYPGIVNLRIRVKVYLSK